MLPHDGVANGATDALMASGNPAGGFFSLPGIWFPTWCASFPGLVYSIAWSPRTESCSLNSPKKESPIAPEPSPALAKRLRALPTNQDVADLVTETRGAGIVELIQAVFNDEDDAFQSSETHNT
jgi:hypothetical protein